MNARRHRAVAALAVASLTLAVSLFVPSGSRAQDSQIGGQRFQPHGSADGILGTEGAETRPDFDPYLALWLHYTLNAIVVENQDGDRLAEIAEHVLGLDLVASLMLAYGFEIGLSAPFTLACDGDLSPIAGVASPEAPSIHDLSARIAWRWQITDTAALAFHLPILLPTASDDDPLALGFGVRPTVAFAMRFGAPQLIFNLSYLFRERTDIPTGGYYDGDELGASVGFRYSFGEFYETGLLAQLGFATGVREPLGEANTPVEIRGGIEHQISDKLLFTGFLGTGLSTGVGAPDFRIGLSLAYVDKASRRTNPRSGDRDGDDIEDEDDRAPDDAEDYDDFQDRDGAPEEDNDRDGYPDDEDECPNAPETRNGIYDEDGCPDYIELQEGGIRTYDSVHFRSDSDVIEERSYPMLDEVAATMNANPDMVLSVEGHTDNAGDDNHNMDLSRRRAAAVRQYLIDKGVDGGRIRSEGYGETRPIASNNTRAGRAKNRRVDFIVGHMDE